MDKLLVLGLVALALVAGVAAPAAAQPFDPIRYVDAAGGYASCVVAKQSAFFVVYCGTPPLP